MMDSAEDGYRYLVIPWGGRPVAVAATTEPHEMTREDLEACGLERIADILDEPEPVQDAPILYYHVSRGHAVETRDAALRRLLRAARPHRDERDRIIRKMIEMREADYRRAFRRGQL